MRCPRFINNDNKLKGDNYNCANGHIDQLTNVHFFVFSHFLLERALVVHIVSKFSTACAGTRAGDGFSGATAPHSSLREQGIAKDRCNENLVRPARKSAARFVEILRNEGRLLGLIQLKLLVG
jgi:hypothetical protein